MKRHSVTEPDTTPYRMDPRSGRVVDARSLGTARALIPARSLVPAKTAPAREAHRETLAEFLVSDMAVRKRVYLKALDTASKEQLEIIDEAERLATPAKRRRPRGSRAEPA